MTEFGTRAMLDVTVSESSLSDARDQIESALGSGGGGVRASITPAISDGGQAGGGGGGLRDRLTEQTDVLIQIRDAIEEQAFSQAAGGGGGGTTIISGGGALGKLGSAAGTAARAAGPIGLAAGAGYLAQDQLGKFEPEKLLGLNKNPLFNLLNGITGGGAGAVLGIGNILLGQSGDIGEALGLVDDADAFEQSLIDGARDAKQQLIEGSKVGVAFWTKDIPSAIANLDPPSWVQDLTSFRLTEPQWLSNLTSYQLTEPQWLADLTSFRLTEPEWISDLRSLLGQSESQSASGPPQAGARVPGSQVNADVTVNAQTNGLERDLQRALRNVNFERFITRVVRQQFNI